MMERGKARAGGMPLYKYVGNRILTTFENRVVGLELTEWHTGYRAYSVAALRDIDLDGNSDGFDFDTEIILQLHGAGKRIVEMPIPTYYGDEICYVNGMKYAKDVTVDVLRYKARRMGFGTGPSGLTPLETEAYELKPSPTPRTACCCPGPAGRRPAPRVLDVGCSDGQFGALCAARATRSTASTWSSTTA